MKRYLLIVVGILLIGCERPKAHVLLPRPVIVVWSSNPFSTPEEVKIPELVVYDDGTLIARFYDRENMFDYRRGTISESQRSALLEEAVAYFGSAEYQEHFEQARGSDYTTTAVVLHAGSKVVGTSMYGVGLWSVIKLGDTLDFAPEVTGIPSKLCRLLAQLYFVKEIATEKWTSFHRDRDGIPVLPNGDVLNATSGDVGLSTSSKG